jgi:uncharacterized OB-fold protein
VLATVDLEEEVRMIAQLRDVAPDAVTVGLPVLDLFGYNYDRRAAGAGCARETGGNSH